MSTSKLTPQELREALRPLPRVALGHWPTPLDEMPRLSKEFGIRLLMKRDDCTGFYFGGNKTRHNEFLIGDALASGCDTVVWGAELQSNNCRQTAAACAKFGLECRLYLSPGQHRRQIQGNLLLDYLVGAKVEIVDAKIGLELDDLIRAKAAEARQEGRRPYFWDRPRVVPRSALSYALCIAEIAEQCDQLGIMSDAVYLSSAGATGAGAALGKKLLGVPWPVRSVCPMNWPWDIPENLAATANAAAELIGLTPRLEAPEIETTTNYVGEYGRPSAEGQAAFNLVARREGVLLDPVYTAKAMAGLIADIRCGRIASGSTVVFIHTGGTPVVFAMAEELIKPV